jgi:hypothetical protein
MSCAHTPRRDTVMGRGGRVDLGEQLASSSDAFPYKSRGLPFRFDTLTCILAFLALPPPSLGFIALVPVPPPLPQLSFFRLRLPWICGFARIAPTHTWRASSGAVSFMQGLRQMSGYSLMAKSHHHRPMAMWCHSCTSTSAGTWLLPAASSTTTRLSCNT